MIRREPISPNHSALIISNIGRSTYDIEKTLHTLNISHRYAELDPLKPSGLNFLWDINEFRFDLIIILDEGFSDDFIESALKTAGNSEFKGKIFLITNKLIKDTKEIALIPNDDRAEDELEKAIRFFVRKVI